MSFKIHCLELTNFKSYADKVIVGPFKNFTCIVGPNGAGKSNLMDAFKFILSPATSNDTEANDPSKFINYRKKECSVTIVLRHKEDPGGSDVTSKQMPGLDDKLEEVVLTRSVSVAGVSKFLVNGKQISAEKFLDELKQYRIACSVNTFLVFQHEVEAITRMKGMELTKFLEQVSGSEELRNEYNSKKEALEVANSCLLTASNEKRGALASASQVRMAISETERFNEMRNFYETRRQDLALVELFKIELNLQRQKHELGQFSRTLQQLQKSVISEKDLQKIKHRYAERHRAYLGEVKTSRRLGEEVRIKLSLTNRVKIRLEHLSQKYKLQNSELMSLLKFSNIHSNEMKRLQSELQRKESILANFEKQSNEEHEKKLEQNAIRSEHLTEYKRLRKEADCETVMLRQHAEAMRCRYNSIQEALKQCEMTQQNIFLQRKDLKQNQERMASAEAQLEQRWNDLNESIVRLKKQISESLKTLNLTQNKSVERENELAKIQSDLQELHYVKDTNKHQQRLTEALQMLRSLFPIYGRLVDLCTIPNSQYRNAVTVAMGKYMDAIVVKTSDVALSCVRYLKKQHMPPMTFLSLDSIQVDVELNKKLPGFGGTCRLLTDVMRYEPDIEPVVYFVLGKTVVCDSLLEAKKIAFGASGGERPRIVTLDGTMLLKNGTLQGGLESLQIRNKKWDEKKYMELHAAYKRLNDSDDRSDAEIARMHIAIRDMKSRLQFMENRTQQVVDEKQILKVKQQSLAEEMHKLAETEESVKTHESSLKQEIDNISKDMLKTSQAIAKTEGVIFSEFQKKRNSTILQLGEDHAELEKLQLEQHQRLQFHIRKLKQAIEMESSRFSEDLIISAKEACAKIDSEITEYKRKLHAYQSDLVVSEEDHDRARLVALKSSEELRILANEIQQITQSSEAMLNRLVHARKGITALQGACDTLRLHRFNTVQRCQMDEINLPLRVDNSISSKRGGTNDTALCDVDNLTKTLMRSETFTLLNESSRNQKNLMHDAKSQLYIDFSGLSPTLRDIAADRSKFAAYKQHTEASIENISMEMEALVPNIRAASHHVLPVNRLEASSEALKAAREQVRKMHADFVKVKELRTARFMETFRKIAESVDYIYRKLTLGLESHGIHASAYLSLENAEEPYLGGATYHITPPRKHFMSMELLSGGERTMAALALLFAIHDALGTSFFVLDEVDAALDAVNVGKLANFLCSASSKHQFVVVSLKDQLYHRADNLIGVLKDKEKNSSRVLTMDLGKFSY